MTSPIGRYVPDKTAVLMLQEKLGCSIFNARRILIKQNMTKACDEAQSVEDLRHIVRALISCAKLD